MFYGFVLSQIDFLVFCLHLFEALQFKGNVNGAYCCLVFLLQSSWSCSSLSHGNEAVSRRAPWAKGMIMLIMLLCQWVVIYWSNNRYTIRYASEWVCWYNRCDIVVGAAVHSRGGATSHQGSIGDPAHSHAHWRTTHSVRHFRNPQYRSCERVEVCVHLDWSSYCTCSCWPPSFHRYQVDFHRQCWKWLYVWACAIPPCPTHSLALNSPSLLYLYINCICDCMHPAALSFHFAVDTMELYWNGVGTSGNFQRWFCKLSKTQSQFCLSQSMSSRSSCDWPRTHNCN